MGTRRPMGKVVELKAQGARVRLREAAEQGTLIRLWRGGLEAGSFTGYVAGIGREFFLLWAVGDYIGFDGIYALRHRDITELEAPDASRKFIEKAMALKDIRPDLPTAWDLDSAEGVVRSACAARAVIAVHVDTEGPNEICFVGRLLAHEPEGFMLQEITPDADWLRESSFFGYDEVSAVAISSPYNDALEMVAGTPPDDVQPARDQAPSLDADGHATPDRIKLHRASHVLEVAFDTGEVFHLPCEYLRVYSPSAEVMGHGHGQRVLQLGKQHVNIAAIESVGNYAVLLRFDDGHETGIYSWQTLYELGTQQDEKWRQYLAELAAAGQERA